MLPDEEKAIERAERKLAQAEERAARIISEARAELARAMLAAGASAVARRNGVTRQSVHEYIQRNLAVSPDSARKLPSRRSKTPSA